MRKFIAASLVTVTMIGVPTAAFAAKPTHPTHPTTPASVPAKPTVTYVLRGTLGSYTAATTTTAGSVTITVKSSNFESKVLKGQALTFALNSKTTVVLHDHKAIANGDRGIVKVRAPKDSTASTLQTRVAFQVIDQGLTR